MQLLEYPSVAEKRWEWHHVLFKEWLRLVQPGVAERKYLKWLRTRKVFERRFIAFGELLLGVQRGPQVAANDVGDELLEALDASEARAREAMEAQQAAALARPSGRPEARPGAPPAAPPGRRGPPGQQPGGTNGRPGAPAAARGKPGPAADDDLPDGGPDGGPDDDAAALGPPSAENDPFVKALLERLVELNQYLAMFAYREIGDGFLAPAELMRRINTSAYEGARPTVVQLDGWIQWLEWLGGLKKIGFRHKATTVGREVGAYLVEMPARELFGDDPSVTTLALGKTDEEAEPEAPPAAVLPALVAREPGQRPPRTDDDGDGPGAGDDEALGADEAQDEGLDLPPEGQAAPDADAYWKRPAPAADDDGLGPVIPAPTVDLDPVVPAPVLGAPEPEPAARPPAPVMPPPSKERVSFELPPPPPSRAEAKPVLPPPSKERVSFELPPPPPSRAEAKPVMPPPSKERVSFELPPPAPPSRAEAKPVMPPPSKERVSFEIPPPPPGRAEAKPVLPPPSKERVSFELPPPPPARAEAKPIMPPPSKERVSFEIPPPPARAEAAPRPRAGEVRGSTPPPTARVAPARTPTPTPPTTPAAEVPAPLPTPSTGGPRPSIPTSDAWPRPSGGWGRPLPPVEDPLRLAVGWWLDDRAPRTGLAVAAGIPLAPHPSGKPVAVHKVLALAALVEVGPLEAAVELVHGLEGALEAHLVDGAPLDLVLEAAAARGASPAFEQRLAVLARFRRGLLALPPRALEGAKDARALARTLRDAVTGDVLGPGLVFAVRELVNGGLFRVPGLEAIDWLPWPAPPSSTEGPYGPGAGP